MRTPASDNLRGILWMTLGMAAASSVDVSIKLAYGGLAQHQIASIVGLGTALVMLLLARFRGSPLRLWQALHPLVFLRIASEVIGVYALVLALSAVSVTLLTTLVQGVPLLVTLGAVIFLRQRAEWRDWAVLVIGLCAVLLILRPGAEALQPGTGWALVAVLGLAIRDLSSRLVPQNVSTMELGVLSGLGLGLVGLVLSALAGEPLPALTLRNGLVVAAVVIFAALTFYGITASMRSGDVAVIAPFRYTRLIFGVSLGVLIFGDAVDAMTLLGALIIVGCGLYGLRREVLRQRSTNRRLDLKKTPVHPPLT